MFYTDWHFEGQCELGRSEKRDSPEKEQMIASNFYRFGYNKKACEKLSEQLQLIKNGTDLNALIRDG